MNTPLNSATKYQGNSMKNVSVTGMNLTTNNNLNS